MCMLIYIVFNSTFYRSNLCLLHFKYMLPFGLAGVKTDGCVTKKKVGVNFGAFLPSPFLFLGSYSKLPLHKRTDFGNV